MAIGAHSRVRIVERMPSVEEFLQLRGDAGWPLPPTVTTLRSCGGRQRQRGHQ